MIFIGKIFWIHRLFFQDLAKAAGHANFWVFSKMPADGLQVILRKDKVCIKFTDDVIIGIKLLKAFLKGVDHFASG